MPAPSVAPFRERVNVPRKTAIVRAMIERRASRTALLVAAYRARASRRESPLVVDPWAAALVGPEGEALANEVDRFLDDRELWTAVRTAYLDGHVLHWTREQALPQVVILGAGLDTRAARLAHEGVRFFEVDHPATQADKLARLGRVDGYPIASATYVACDFERDDFLERLGAEGFRTDAPAVIVWEGVTPYLKEEAVRATLARVAGGCHPRSVLLFDHFLKRFIEAANTASDAKTHAFVDALGEKFVWGTNDPVPMLYEAGFRHVRSVSFDEACLTLTGTYDRAREFRFQRIVLASRTPSARM
ncbi:MAG TPA: SAM-dependent methyltransferase [Labilithrix sp.]